MTCEPSIVFSRLLKKQAAEVSGEKSGEALDRVAGEKPEPFQAAAQGPAPHSRDLKLAHV